MPTQSRSSSRCMPGTNYNHTGFQIALRLSGITNVNTIMGQLILCIPTAERWQVRTARNTS